MSAPQKSQLQSDSGTAKGDFAEKIDMFCHILPGKYKEALFKKAKPGYYIEMASRRPALFDLDVRLRVMDNFEGLRQVLTLSTPPLEHVLPPRDAAELARMANDGMAEIVNKHPDRFVAAAASLPLNDIDASLRETERAIEELKFKGIQMYSSINGKPLDRPEFLGLYEKLSQYGLPIWIHPARDSNIPDYPDENVSKYGLFSVFGWPYETTLAMSRLVFSGVMEKYPNINFIAHHCGAMLPFFSKRAPGVLGEGKGVQSGEVMKLSKRPLEYFRQFYADTVLGGNTRALMVGYDFFGADNILFGTDYPYPGGAEKGEVALGEAISSVEQMDVSDEEKAKIFSKNARRILNLS
jgi:predicted TIM-barrel fold metal-dependent hydrolase